MATMEAKAKQGQFEIPSELLDVHVMTEMKWTYSEYLTTPIPIINKLLFLWRLNQIAENANNKPGKK